MHVNESSTPDEDSDPSSVCDVALETGDDEQTTSDCMQRLPASDSQLEPEGENAPNTYFTRVAGNIISNFYGNLPKGRPTLAFRQKMENASRKEKDFWTKADPDIDTWLLIFGQVREIFHLESFVKKYPNVDGPLSDLRRIVRRQVLQEDCPVVTTKRKLQSTTAVTRLNVKRRRVREKTSDKSRLTK